MIGTAIVSSEVSKIMLSQKSGRIINFSSMAVGLHQEGTSAYSSSKAALVEYTKIMAKELFQINITCNVISISMFPSDAFYELGDKIITKAKEKLIYKNILNIEEICNVIDFFFKDKSKIVTGQEIYLGMVS